MQKMKTFLAFDIGGTKIAYALVSQDGQMLTEQTRVATPKDNHELFALLKNIVMPFEAKVDGVAIATAGEVNKDNSAIIASVGNMPEGYMHTDFLSLSRKPVYVENDANAAMWGEYRLGAAKGTENSMLVAIGTGVGLAFIVNGKLLKGKSGAGGEAHFSVNREKKRQCSCGLWDCYEIYASGTALGIDAKEVYGRDDVSSHDVIKGLKEKNPLAEKAYHIWENDVVRGIAGLANIFDPEVVVLFGSLTAFMDFEKLQKEVNQQIVTMPLVLKHAILENNAALIGATLGAAEKLCTGN